LNAGRLLILDNELKMGGKEKLLYEFIARTDPGRLHISVCCLKAGGYYKERLEALGVPFHDGLLLHRFDALAFRPLANLLRRERIDVVETFTHPNTLIFSFLARQQGLVSAVVVSHHAVGSAYQKRVLPGYVLPLLRRIDLHIAVAESQKRYLVDVEGIPEDRIRVIYNGVDTTAYHPAGADERAASRAALGVPRDARVLMAVGSLKPLKGIDRLIRAAAPALKADADARLVLVGEGPDRDALQRLAVEAGVAAQVVFAGLRGDVDHVLRAADAYVLSSHTEALPTVIMEAMATGLPVIATRVGGVPELVEADRTALMVEAGDETALRAAIARIMQDASLREALGRRGREVAEARFRIEAMCAAREAIFVEFASRSRRAASQGVGQT
jgi:glycosyltransferase involved in cell wall biosynthesis